MKQMGSMMMEMSWSDEAPAICHRVVFQFLADFLLDLMDGASTKLESSEARDQKPDVHAFYVEERINDGGSTGSGISCPCCKQERGKCLGCDRDRRVLNFESAWIKGDAEMARGDGYRLLHLSRRLRKLDKERQPGSQPDINGTGLYVGLSSLQQVKVSKQ